MKTSRWVSQGVSQACRVSVIAGAIVGTVVGTISGTISAPLAFARDLTPQNFSALPNATMDIPAAKLFCTRYFVTNNPYTSSQFSSSPSQTTGDQWCAEHGVINGPYYAPSGSSVSTSTSTGSGQGTCQTATLTGADSTAGLSCGAVTDAIESCNLHGTQLQTQCEALLAAVGGSCGDSGLQGNVSESANADGSGNCQASKGATFWDTLLEAADIAVAVDCGYVCAGETLTFGASTVTTEQVCKYSAMAAGASDILLNKVMKQNGPVSGFLQQWGGLAGVGAGAYMDKTFSNGAVKDGKNPTDPNGTNKELACGTAALFAMMASARNQSISKTWNLAQGYVDSINSLISSAMAANGSSGNSNPMYATVYKQSGGGSGTGSGGSGGSNTISGSSLAQAQNCLATGNLSTCAQQSGFNTTQGAMSAPDANLLNGLGPNLGQLLKGTSLPALASQAQSQGVPAAMGSAMPASAGSSDLGQGLVALSKVASDNPKELAALGISSQSYGSAGGGRALASAKSSDNPFASLLGGGNMGPTAMGGSSTFATAPKLGDIWHTGSSQSLFEIVSQKIGTVSNRVR